MDTAVGQGQQVSALVTKLLAKLLPPSVDDAKVVFLRTYCMRILGSTLGSSLAYAPAPEVLFQQLKRQMARVYSDQGQEEVRIIDRLDLLYGSFEVSKQIRKKWAVLKLLQGLLGTGVGPSPRVDGDFSVPLTFRLNSLGDGVPDVPNRLAPVGPAGTSGEGTRDSYSRPARPKRGAAVDPGLLKYQLNDQSSFSLSQQLLLRDVIFAFQGINGKYIRHSSTKGHFVVDPKVSLPNPVRVLLSKLCHMGCIYRDINSIMEGAQRSGRIGLVAQSLYFVFQEELTDYFRLLAVLEAQVDIDDPTGSRAGSSAADTSPLGRAGLTLRRLFVWVQDPYERLRLIHSVAQGTEGIGGGALISAVYAFTRHGDPLVRSFVATMMREISVPMYAMIRRWLFEGVLEDPHGEFFIAEHAGVSKSDMWRGKYSLRESMLPSFLSIAFAKKILQIGTTINFIRSCCGEAQWILDPSGKKSLQVEDFEFGQHHLLVSVVENASLVANKFVVDIVVTKFELWKHLTAVKSYLLLGKGDFVASLMDALVPELGKPASHMYRHNLLGLLDGAVRASNAQYDDEEVLQRLDLKLLPANVGDDGWSVFSLDYSVSAPLDTLFTKSAMDQYLQVFRHLWRIKRVAHLLASLWQRLANSRHLLRGLPILSGWLTSVHLLRTEMNLFMDSIQSYLMFEVLETSWGRLREDVDSAKDLDEIIRAHEEYQRRMMDAALLSADHSLLRQGLNQLLDVVLAFCAEHDRALTTALEIIHRKNMLQQKIEQQLDAGHWGVDTTGGASEDFEESDAILTDAASTLSHNAKLNVTVTRKDFTAKVVTFMNLAEKTARGKGQNLHLLAFRMNFNEFYDDARTRLEVPGNESEEEDEPAFEERLLRQLGAARAPFPHSRASEKAVVPDQSLGGLRTPQSRRADNPLVE